MITSRKPNVCETANVPNQDNYTVNEPLAVTLHKEIRVKFSRRSNHLQRQIRTEVLAVVEIQQGRNHIKRELESEKVELGLVWGRSGTESEAFALFKCRRNPVYVVCTVRRQIHVYGYIKIPGVRGFSHIQRWC